MSKEPNQVFTEKSLGIEDLARVAGIAICDQGLEVLQQITHDAGNVLKTDPESSKKDMLPLNLDKLREAGL